HRGRHAAPAAPGRPRHRLPRRQRPRVLPLHEDDHAREAAARAARGPRRGARRPRARGAGTGRRPADDRDRAARGWRVSAQWEAEADLVVVGSGVAGLTAALDAAELGLRVVVVTKDAPDAGSTGFAQGGIAVVLGDVPGDSVEAHI